MGAVGRANHKDQVNVLGDLLDCLLAILRSVANIVAGRTFDGWESLAEARDNFLCVVETQRGLRQERKFFRIIDLKSVDSGNGIDHDGAIGGFTGGADNFLVIAMPNQNNGALFSRNLEGLELNFGDQGTAALDYF